MWTIVFLAMGGIALGKGVMSSGLLEVMDVLIRKLVDGKSLFSVVLLLAPVVLVRAFTDKIRVCADCLYLRLYQPSSVIPSPVFSLCPLLKRLARI
jgi:hypothetical protein